MKSLITNKEEKNRFWIIESGDQKGLRFVDFFFTLEHTMVLFALIGFMLIPRVALKESMPVWVIFYMAILTGWLIAVFRHWILLKNHK